MPSSDFYPTGVKLGWSFTTTELNKLIGYRGGANANAIYSGQQGVNNSYGGVFYFDFSIIPANSIINTIQCWFLARSNVANYDATYDFAINDQSLGTVLLLTNSQALTTTNGWHGKTSNPGNSSLTASLLKSNTEYQIDFIKLITSNTTTYWDVCMIRVDWTPPVAGGKSLFFGTDF